MQNFGKGAAENVLFAEIDANNMVRHYLRLNPVLEGQKVYFDKEQFRHCITLVAKYQDISNHKYHCICQGGQTKYFRKDPRADITAVPMLESSLTPFITRK